MELVMGDRDRLRLRVVSAVAAGKMLQREAGEVLDRTIRQIRRMLQRYRAEGDSGLLHRLRGRRSARRVSDRTQKRAVSLIRSKYVDFGPTLASEYLAERHDIEVSRETLRKWMVQAELWKARRRHASHHQGRERKACFGEMVQMDTSEHDWFEGRGPRPVLITMIDDATSRALKRFFAADTTKTNLEMIRRWIQRYGRPKAIYADKASHFRVNRPATTMEALEGIEAETQIGRALRELDIVYIAANSPQAKGRVERSFGTTQDRLVKALRIEKISTIEEANRYLEEHFLPLWEKRFTRPPSCEVDVHRSARGSDLDGILSAHTPRTVANDYTIKYNGHLYQIERQGALAGLRGSKLVVQDRLDGTLRLSWRSPYLPFHRVETGDLAVAPPPRTTTARSKPDASSQKPWTPPPEHPWRKTHIRKRRAVTVKADPPHPPATAAPTLASIQPSNPRRARPRF